MVWSVKINCMSAGDSFWRNQFRLLAKSRSCVDFILSAQVEIMCRFRRDRVSISSGVHWISAQIWEIFTEVYNYRERGNESLMKLVEFNLDSDFVFEKESDEIEVS